MNMYKLTGIVCGMLVGMILCVVCFRYAHTDKKLRAKYDERQQAIRNNGYRYAFYSVLFYEVLMLVLGTGDIQLPLADYAVHFLGIIIGCTVLSIYCIWNDAFWGLNNNRKRYMLVFAAVTALNLIPVAITFVSGDLFTNEEYGIQIINLMVFIMFAIMFVTLMIKSAVDSKTESREDDI